MHLVGYKKEIYYDARLHKYKIYQTNACYFHGIVLAFLSSVTLHRSYKYEDGRLIVKH